MNVHLLLIVFAVLFFVVAASSATTKIRFEWLAFACLALSLLV